MCESAIIWPTETPDEWNMPDLRDDEVHVWAAPLAVSASALATLKNTLSYSELERAARFRFERHRDRFIAGRGMLRVLLGRYLRADARQLEFEYGAAGKPELRGKPAGNSPHFNLAHSEDLALVAITRAAAVGVDVERVRPLKDSSELVSRFFSPREHALFKDLPESQKAVAFFNLWTRKEAWLKATGEGIAHSLHLVEVSFLPGEPARLLTLPESRGSHPSWALLDLQPAPGFVAALAIAAQAPKLRCWRWTGDPGQGRETAK